MKLIASHIVREFMKYDFYNLADLASQLKADYFGVVPMEFEKASQEGVVPKKVVYMAYVKEDEWAATLQYTVIITISIMEEEEVWTRVTEENHELYAPTMETMLNLYEKQDCPELLTYDCEHCIFLNEVSEATEHMVREAVRKYVEENGIGNEEEYSFDDEDIPF